MITEYTMPGDRVAGGVMVMICRFTLGVIPVFTSESAFVVVPPVAMVAVAVAPQARTRTEAAEVTASLK
jgi:hypothetical protein